MSGNFAIKGGGVGPLIANAILKFHFDFLTTSLSLSRAILVNLLPSELILVQLSQLGFTLVNLFPYCSNLVPCLPISVDLCPMHGFFLGSPITMAHQSLFADMLDQKGGNVIEQCLNRGWEWFIRAQEDAGQQQVSEGKAQVLTFAIHCILCKVYLSSLCFVLTSLLTFCSTSRSLYNEQRIIW